MYVARENRTNASAIFVSLSAVGMALGPLLALPLQHVPEFKVFGKSCYGVSYYQAEFYLVVLFYQPERFGSWLTVSWLRISMLWSHCVVSYSQPKIAHGSWLMTARNYCFLLSISLPLLNFSDSQISSTICFGVLIDHVVTIWGRIKNLELYTYITVQQMFIIGEAADLCAIACAIRAKARSMH